MSKFLIDKTEIGGDRCYVIAEVGHNHQGSLDTAKELFAAAKAAGADAVKLQKRDNASLYTPEYFDRPYDNENSFGPTYGLHREALEFGRDEYLELKAYAAELGITFFATAFDVASVDLLAELDMPAFKLASGDLTNTPLLRYVASIGKPVIFSTGGGTLGAVLRAHDAIAEVNEQVGVLQCTAGYPAAWEELDLRVIETYREAMPGAVVGFSGHDNGIAMAMVAYAMGARIVEKHFTLNRAMRGTDHAYSLEPAGLRKLVRDLRRAEVALGSPIKRPHASEVAPLIKMAKKIVAARPLTAGHVLGWDDLEFRSPGDGMAPHEAESLIGNVLLAPLARGDSVDPDLVAEASLELGRSARLPALDYGA